MKTITNILDTETDRIVKFTPDKDIYTFIMALPIMVGCIIALCIGWVLSYLVKWKSNEDETT